MTDERLFRCDDCGWRGWLALLPPDLATAIVVVPPPDWASLDSEVKLQPVAGPQSFSPSNLQ
jgi:hypothetical protein